MPVNVPKLSQLFRHPNWQVRNGKSRVGFSFCLCRGSGKSLSVQILLVSPLTQNDTLRLQQKDSKPMNLNTYQRKRPTQEGIPTSPNTTQPKSLTTKDTQKRRLKKSSKNTRKSLQKSLTNNLNITMRIQLIDVKGWMTNVATSKIAVNIHSSLSGLGSMKNALRHVKIKRTTDAAF